MELLIDPVYHPKLSGNYQTFSFWIGKSWERMEEGVMGDHENWEEEEKREIRELGEDQIMFVISIICFIFFETSPSVSHSFHYP